VTIRYLPPASNGGFRVTHYLIDVRPGNRLYTCTSTYCSIKELTNGVSYVFTVAAVNRVGRGLFSSPSKRVTPIAPTPEITFNANGGTGVTPTEEENSSGTTVLSASSFTYVNHTFASWNTEADGSGTSYSNGSAYVGNADVTLYAQWVVGTYTVTFDANDSSGASITDTVSGGDSIILLNTFTNPGYSFASWNTAANGSGTSFADNVTYSGPASITLYAQWTVVNSSGSAPGGTSSNWSGYVLTGQRGGYQAVSAEWTVPTLNCAVTPNGATADWVGVNGLPNSPGLFQDGTSSNCINGVEESNAWWTDEAENFLSQTVFVVQSGDLIEAQVYQDASGYWVYFVKDLTTGEVSTQVEPYSGAATSAEWIAEDPGDPNAGGLYLLADFGSVTFTDLGLTVPGGTWYEPPYSDAIEMIAPSGAVETLPTQVSGSGASAAFTVHYESSG